MSSIKDIEASNQVPADLARKIGIGGVAEILTILWQGYHALKSDSKIIITSSTPEDEITQEWFVKIQRRWDSRNRATCLALNIVVPHHQYGDDTMAKSRGKKPTIDFCFRDWEINDSYFGAECKNLYKHEPAKIKRYVNKGVMNYVSGKYGSHSSVSSMVGYVLSGDIPTIVEQLKVEIQKKSPISNLTRELSTAEPQYKTRHTRTLDGEKITLHHLFFSFVA